MTDETDILIAGGGVAGLTAAAALGNAGFRVTLADPQPPVTDAAADGADLRTTAILQPGRALLDSAGVWDLLATEATPLRVMRIVDAGGAEPVERARRDFDASEIGDLPFGWNLPNWLLRRALVERLSALPTVRMRAGTGFAGMTLRDSAAIVRLSDGAQVRARLVIGADGRESAVREAAGIGVRRLGYGQKAVVLAVTHPVPHDNVSTEVHRTGGPFTLVPLPDHDGRPCSAVVWMTDGADAARLMTLDDAAFGAEATARSAWLAGPLTPVTRRQVWPIVTQWATAMTAPRTALMAEAAHVLPPIGAQGLNMSLADLAVLLDLLGKAPGDPGAPAILTAYAKARESEVRLRLAGIDLLNRASQVSFGPLRDLRARGLQLLHDVRPVRRALMRLGLGAGR